MHIRPYQAADWTRLCQIHDAARLDELRAGGLADAYLTLEQTAENEGLFEYQLRVAELDQTVEGFVAYTDEELAWLYVSPDRYRQGIARKLVRHVLEAAGPEISVEVLVGNEAALQLYLAEGFQLLGRTSGKLPGNESFAVTCYELRRSRAG